MNLATSLNRSQRALLVVLWLMLGGLLAISCKTQTSLSNTNLEYQYDPLLSLQITSRPWWRTPQQQHVVVRIKTRKLATDVSTADFLKRYSLSWELFANYESNQPLAKDTIYPRHVTRYGNGDYGLLLPLTQVADLEEAVWVLRIQDNASKLYILHDCLVSFRKQDLGQEYALHRAGDSLPLTLPYVWTTDSLLVMGPGEQVSGKLVLKHWPDAFPAPLPAMALSAPPKGPAPAGPVEFNQASEVTNINPGLYLVAPDTTKGIPGFSFVAFKNRYPRLVTEEELIAPLIYLTTREERKKLAEADNAKLVLDQFWLGIGGSRESARRVLKAYYAQVETANQLFTTFKEGWRTDMGMIYIIFGKPERVSRTRDRETWSYTRKNSEQGYSFTFVRKPTIFTPNNFELVRFADYADLWYSTVDEWRRGILKN